jgi:hypothetical protein
VEGAQEYTPDARLGRPGGTCTCCRRRCRGYSPGRPKNTARVVARRGCARPLRTPPHTAARTPRAVAAWVGREDELGVGSVSASVEKPGTNARTVRALTLPRQPQHPRPHRAEPCYQARSQAMEQHTRLRRRRVKESAETVKPLYFLPLRVDADPSSSSTPTTLTLTLAGLRPRDTIHTVKGTSVCSPGCVQAASPIARAEWLHGV